MENLEFPITHGLADRRRRSVAGFTVAFAASALLHVLLFFFWPGSTAPLRAPVSLELTLVSPPPPAARERPAPEVKPPPVARQPEAIEAQTPANVADVRATAPVAEMVEEPADPEVIVPEPLDLTLPPGWVAEQEASWQESPEELLPFHPELSRALVQARKRQARSALLAARAGAATGLDAAAFGTRRDALGETVKVDDACFALREDALNASAPRWWRVRCGDVRENAFLRPAPESDAVGRILAD